jgi:CRISPR-associated endonuclease Cas2
MLVLLAYDTPEQKNQTWLRKEFERIGGRRVQYSIYVFEGEPHECERVIRYMRRVAHGIPGDIRLFPMEKTVWDAQIVITQAIDVGEKKMASYPEFVKVW